jgi:hypothetical protein
MMRWAPIVYGRTATSDTWWRAVPEGLDQHGWLGTVVHSALADGRELKQRPRFLLAQNTTHQIVGVACQAGDLGTGMRSVGSRELFCFVGWVAARTGPSEPGPPELEELEGGYARWAAPVYTRILTPVWNEPPTAHCLPVTTQPERVHWTPPARHPKPGLPPDGGPWTEDSWPVIWAAVQAARDPLTCVVGWQHMSSARFEDATHIGVADAPLRPLPRVEYVERVAPPELLEPAEKTPKPEVHPLSVITDGHAPGEPGVSAPVQPGETPADWRSLLDRLPLWAKLTAAAAFGAVAAGLVVAIISSGAHRSSARRSPPPKRKWPGP